MGWLDEDQEGEKMGKAIGEASDAIGKAIVLLAIVYTGVLMWLAFDSNIKSFLRVVQTWITP